MKAFARTIIIFLAVLLAAQGPCRAAEPLVLDSDLCEYLAPFFEEYGLDEDNFAMGYCYTATGESWYYNGDAWMTGGSVYKLPLNMVYCDRLADGTYKPTDLVGGYTIEKAQFASIVESNNEVSEAMQKHLVGNRADYYVPYRREIAKYCGTDPDKLPEEYYESGNFFSPKFMINTLQYLFDHSEDYETLLGYLTQAHPGKYFKKYVDEYEIAHKYGYLDGEVNDAAIVYTPNPFLLTAFTYRAGDGEKVLGKLCELMCEYTLALDEEYSAALAAGAYDVPEPTPTPSPTPEPENSPLPSESPAPAAPAIDIERNSVLIFCVLFAAAVGIFWVVAAIKKRGKH